MVNVTLYFRFKQSSDLRLIVRNLSWDYRSKISIVLTDIRTFFLSSIRNLTAATCSWSLLAPQAGTTSSILLVKTTVCFWNIVRYQCFKWLGYFTRSGSTCDMVGTSYSAFETQGNRCYSPLGTCLSMQIKDLLETDIQNQAAGLPLQYNFQAFSYQKLFKDPSLNQLYSPVSGMQNTLIRVIFDC